MFILDEMRDTRHSDLDECEMRNLMKLFSEEYGMNINQSTLFVLDECETLFISEKGDELRYSLFFLEECEMNIIMLHSVRLGLMCNENIQDSLFFLYE